MSSKRTFPPGSSSADPAAKKAKVKGTVAQEQGSSGQSAVQLCLHALEHCGEQLTHIKDASTLGQIAAQAKQLQQATQQRLQALKTKLLPSNQPEQPSQHLGAQQHIEQQQQQQQQQRSGQPRVQQRWQQQQQQQKQQQQPPPEAKPLQIVEDRQPYDFKQAQAGAAAAAAAPASHPQQHRVPPLQQQYRGSASVVALAERCAEARAVYTAGAAAKVAAPGASTAGPRQFPLGHSSGAAGPADASSSGSGSDRSSDGDTSSSSDCSSSDSSSSDSSSSDSHTSNRRRSGSSDSNRGDSSINSNGNGTVASPSPAAAGKASQQQQQQQHLQCLICLRSCPPQSLMANKLTAACSVCTAGALQGGTSSLARCPKRSCGKQDVRLGPKGWHAGLVGQQHYISVSSAGFRVHYTCKKKKKKKPKQKKKQKMQAPKLGTPKAVAAPGGVQKKQDKDKQAGRKQKVSGL